ncbi:MAG: DUF1571 domain-containing protein [Phycisphaerae bacterium]|nr:DUF1571 domain-containing protein [Phycisphaerae bacterium]
MIQHHVSKRRIRVLLCLALAASFAIQCQRAMVNRNAEMVASPPVAPRAEQAFASPATAVQVSASSVEARAARDPVAFFESLLDVYDRGVRDYTCTFSKQERLGDTLGAMQVVEVMFRERPLSVRFKWIKNQDKCARVLYVAKQWVKDGNELAVVEPGAIARLVVPYVMRPIHGDDAKRSSRRTIDQFGFRNTLALTLKYAKLAREQGVGDFAYKGTSEVDGRETLLFERHLPFTGDGSTWPDRVLVVHIDKEHLLPTLCQSYADDAKSVLLGHYQMVDAKFNVNLPDSTFTKEGMGLQ